MVDTHGMNLVAQFVCLFVSASKATLAVFEVGSLMHSIVHPSLLLCVVHTFTFYSCLRLQLRLFTADFLELVQRY